MVGHHSQIFLGPRPMSPLDRCGMSVWGTLLFLCHAQPNRETVLPFDQAHVQGMHWDRCFKCLEAELIGLLPHTTPQPTQSLYPWGLLLPAAH